MKKLLGEIQSEMMDRNYVHLGDRMIHLADAIGYVQKIDVGKRVYEVDGIIQVESQEQMTARSGVKIVDLRTDYNSPALYARKLWEVLYREVDGRFEGFDGFLCDLRSFESLLSETSGTPFYWHWEPGGMTSIVEYDQKVMWPYEARWKIQRVGDKITVERMRK